MESHKHQPNILWLVVDALRADRLGCYGYHRDTSPNLDALAQAGLRIEVAIAQGGSSLASYPTMLTGLYPTEHGLFHHPGRLDPQIPSISEILGKAGYRTACIGGNPFLSDFFGLTRGFDVAKSWDRINLSVPTGGGLGGMRLSDWPPLLSSSALSALGLRDKGGRHINAQVCNFIDAQQTRPWFCFVHYMEVHSPYWPPLRYRLRFHQRWTDALISPIFAPYMFNDGLTFEGPATARRLRSDQYDAEIAYMDALIAQLIDDLSRRGQLSNTVIIVCSDHGEYLGEKGLFRHAAGLGEILVRVPLVISGTNYVPSGMVKAGVAELRDIPHTICRLLGVTGLASGAGEPVHLLDETPIDRDRAALSEWRRWGGQRRSKSQQYRNLLDNADRTARLLRKREWEYIEYDNGQQALYNIPQDPLEEVNLAPQKPHLVRDFAQQMAQINKNLVPLSDGAVEQEMPADVENRLRDLGYL